MKKFTIIRSSDCKVTLLPDAGGWHEGWMKRIVYPPQAMTKGLFMGISEANPGFPIHRWHEHIIDITEHWEVSYPKGFEEIYYIVAGEGILQWERKGENVECEKVGTGDAIYIPEDPPKHQLVNTSNKPMLVVFCGRPTPIVKFKE